MKLAAYVTGIGMLGPGLDGWPERPGGAAR